MNLRNTLFMLALSAATAAASAAPACHAVSGPTVPMVVELYTSEGCNSCPPADRWLSGIKAGNGVLRAAFHVDYWDRLGWRDRFASPDYTARQTQSQRWSGARFSYTPQVQIDGQDSPQWSQWRPSPNGRPSTIDLSLHREAGSVQMQAVAKAGAPQRLSMWWAVLEDGLVSNVKAGENSGETLHHDAVVRRYGTQAPWDPAHPPQITLPAPEAGTRLLVVVTDAQTHRTAQALELSCPG